MTDIGEYFVGAYLEHIKNCDVVIYNVKDHSKTGVIAQYEVDVIGLSLSTKRAYMCEVKTHITGFNATSRTNRVQLISNQFLAMQNYATKKLVGFEYVFMFWAPKVTDKSLLDEISKNYNTCNIVINAKYKSALEDLIKFAAKHTSKFENPFLRTLQIAKHSKAI
jgi:phage gp37-like protein